MKNTKQRDARRQNGLFSGALISIAIGVLLAGCASASAAGFTTLEISDFGAVGDGKTDDAAAFTQAMQAVHEKAPNVVLKLEKGKIYKVGDREDSMHVFNLQHLTNVIVDGQGSMILNAPSQGYVHMLHSKNVVVKNLFLDNDPLSYTQGEVLAKNQQEGWFDMKIQPGFDLFFTDEELAQRGLKNWDYNLWGAIIDPAQRRIRPGKSSSYRVGRIEHLEGRTYRVHLHENSYAGIKDIEMGDIYFQPRRFNDRKRLLRVNKGSFDIGNIQIDHSSDCKIENVVMYGGRSTMTSRLEYNTGPITFDGFQLRFRPGFDERMVTNWRDGMHCKNNRVGPIIKNCHFEGLLDDSINISSDTIMAAEVLSDRQLRLCNWRGVRRWTATLPRLSWAIPTWPSIRKLATISGRSRSWRSTLKTARSLPSTNRCRMWSLGRFVGRSTTRRRSSTM